jgi:hypothetical protein
MTIFEFSWRCDDSALSNLQRLHPSQCAQAGVVCESYHCPPVETPCGKAAGSPVMIALRHPFREKLT